MMHLPKITISGDTSQLIYAVLVIILIPAALIFNTLFLMRNVQRDMDFELNNKALLVESVVKLQARDKLQDSEKFIADLNELVTDLPEIKAIEIFTLKDDEITPLTSTSPQTESVYDSNLNNLAWGSDEAFSKQIYATIASDKPERIWLVVSSIKDKNDKKIGLINLYISASQIDQITGRTTKDSLIILTITIVLILLMLINHFRFFEISILFKKLSDIDKLKDDFISIASHELKTPLTIISSYAYLIRKNPVLNFERNITVIEQSAQRLKELVDDILDVSRIEQGRITINMTNLNLMDAVVAVINEQNITASQKRLLLKYTPPTQNVEIQADKAKLHQVLTNIIGNAIKYTEKGEVDVYYQIQKGKVTVFVKDTGIGIAQEEISRLFNKFYRVFNDKTQNISGTGLGLWITKQLVEKMNGKIDLQSIVNQGTQVSITFPIKRVL